MNTIKRMVQAMMITLKIKKIMMRMKSITKAIKQKEMQTILKTKAGFSFTKVKTQV